MVTALSTLTPYYRTSGLDPHEYAIVNPGAEDGDYTTGWTLGGGSWLRRSDFGPYVDGSYLWAVGNAASGNIYQDLPAVAGNISRALIDTGKVLMVGGCWMASYQGDDLSRVTIDFYDGLPGSLISTLDSGYVAPEGNLTSNIWVESKITGIMPAGTVTLRMTLWGKRKTGAYCNTHMDLAFMTGFII